MNVEEDLLPVGTKVFARIEALGEMLQPRFSGPFTITKQDKNVTGVEMTDRYARDGLKLVNAGVKDQVYYNVAKKLDSMKNKQGKFK